MRHAMVENGIVTNLIWLYEGNAGDFPNAVALDERPVAIGDGYQNGVFVRGGLPVLTPLEEARELIARLDAAIVDLEYRAALRELALEPI